LPVRPKLIPRLMKRKKRWVCWRYERWDGKWTKVPLNARTGLPASVTDPKTPVTFEEAYAAYRTNKADGNADGIGFVLGDGFVGVDLDDAVDPDTGRLHKWAEKDVADLGSYTEVSPSGTGVKVFLKGKLPGGGNRTGNYELYGKARFFVVTGHRLEGVPDRVRKRPSALARLHARLFPPQADSPNGRPKDNGKPPPPKAASSDGDKPAPTTHGLTDDEVIDKASNAKNGKKFKALWSGDISRYNGDDSRADLALAGMLAYWCGRDGRDQVERLIGQSKLGRRDKWTGRADYGQSTVKTAYEGKTKFYDPNKSKSKTKAGKTEEEGGRKSQADLLVELAEGLELFHTPGGQDGEGYATAQIDDHKETYRLKSTGFRQWLARQFYVKHGKAPGGQALADALKVICGKASHEGAEHEVYVRLACHGGRVYLDLGDEGWRAVRVDRDGWKVVRNPPVKFRRPRGLLPLPTPVEGGSVEELRRFVNVTDGDWPLLLAWLASAMRPDGPFAVLCLYGEQGAAKTTTARVLRGLVDPNVAPTRAAPKEPRDLAIAANNGWFISLNNLSWLPDWLSDALCRLNAGEGFATRSLYTDEDETIFKAARPIILNGIEEVATRGDLLDRALILTLPAVPERERKTERRFFARFNRAAPRILGALLGAVSAGLRSLPDVRLPALPRMADFAEWAAACEPALGLKEGAFLRAYNRNRKVANETVLDTSVVVAPLRAFLKGRGGSWKGPPSRLLELLTAQVGEQAARSKEWPKKPNALAGVLKRLAPALRKAGAQVEFGRERKGKNTVRFISVREVSADGTARKEGIAPAAGDDVRKRKNTVRYGARYEDDGVAADK
jgi:primase-polymerase (primpol)-like protein